MAGLRIRISRNDRDVVLFAWCVVNGWLVVGMCFVLALLQELLAVCSAMI